MQIDRRDRYLGCMIGLAVGDALGTTLECERPGTFEPIKDMEGGGPFRLKPGEWTDDTSMALCLAECLIEYKGFDPWAKPTLIMGQLPLERGTLVGFEGYYAVAGVC